MENVKFEKKGNILTVTIDLSVKGSPSKSGKSIVLASTLGNHKIEDTENTFIGINVYKTR